MYECPICFEKRFAIAKSKKCGHKICVICLKMILHSTNLHNKCPFCRDILSNKRVDYVTEFIGPIDNNYTMKIESLNNALRESTWCGEIKVVQMLIDKKANVNQGNEHGTTPLFLASQFNHIKIVQLLLSHKANINQTENDGFSPLFIATQMGFIKIVKLLIKKNANINQCDKVDGASPLFVASQNGLLNVVKLLIINNAKINQTNNNDVSPLHKAAQKGYLDIVKLLIKNNANINQCSNAHQLTPLMFAEIGKQQHIIEYLSKLHNKEEEV